MGNVKTQSRNRYAPYSEWCPDEGAVTLEVLDRDGKLPKLGGPQPRLRCPSCKRMLTLAFGALSCNLDIEEVLNGVLLPDHYKFPPHKAKKKPRQPPLPSDATLIARFRQTVRRVAVDIRRSRWVSRLDCERNARGRSVWLQEAGAETLGRVEARSRD